MPDDTLALIPVPEAPVEAVVNVVVPLLISIPLGIRIVSWPAVAPLVDTYLTYKVSGLVPPSTLADPRIVSITSTLIFCPSWLVNVEPFIVSSVVGNVFEVLFNLINSFLY